MPFYSDLYVVNPSGSHVFDLGAIALLDGSNYGVYVDGLQINIDALVTISDKTQDALLQYEQTPYGRRDDVEVIMTAQSAAAARAKP